MPEPRRPRPDAEDDPSADRDRSLLVYGRRPVLEALADDALEVLRVAVAEGARGPEVGEIVRRAEALGVRVRRMPAARLSLVSRNGRQDQGVLCDVLAPRMAPLGAWLQELDGATGARVLVLDGLTNPANVGMVLRSATAAGVDGVVVPRRGVADLGPLVVKASAGVAFRAPVLRVEEVGYALSALTDAGFAVLGLDADGERPLPGLDVPARCALVVGGEHAGFTPGVSDYLHGRVAIPMAGDVESLNAACAATLAAYALAGGR